MTSRLRLRKTRSMVWKACTPGSLSSKKILKTMPNKGFQQLSAENLTKNGPYATKVTGPSGRQGH